MPFWPRLYNNLATDIDCRVREAAQQAHRALVVSVKRDIAPFMKQFMGTWFVSRFDSHLSAANIAKSSFQVRLFVSVLTWNIRNSISSCVQLYLPDGLSTVEKHRSSRIRSKRDSQLHCAEYHSRNSREPVHSIEVGIGDFLELGAGQVQ